MDTSDRVYGWPPRLATAINSGLCRKGWVALNGALGSQEVWRLHELEAENARPKRLVAERDLGDRRDDRRLSGASSACPATRQAQTVPE